MFYLIYFKLLSNHKHITFRKNIYHNNAITINNPMTLSWFFLMTMFQNKDGYQNGKNINFKNIKIGKKTWRHSF
jgi:hypothetical protein